MRVSGALLWVGGVGGDEWGWMGVSGGGMHCLIMPNGYSVFLRVMEISFSPRKCK